MPDAFATGIFKSRSSNPKPGSNRFELIHIKAGQTGGSSASQSAPRRVVDILTEPIRHLGDDSPGVSEQAWELTRQLSPRGTVRVASTDAGGHPTNEYTFTHRLNEVVPDGPWAINLAGTDGLYRFLCFDLDAKAGNAAYDASKLGHWLDDLNIPFVTCQSGPAGGRHVWLALDHRAPAAAVKTLGQLAQQLLPSLDRAPLSNPASGCARPPGAPHRAGGYSTPLSSLAPLLRRGTTAQHLAELQAFLLDAGATLAPPPVSLMKGMGSDPDGHPHLVGPTRPVSARVRALMNQGGGPDASRTLAVVLAGCARARWRFTDLTALLPTSPALDHARSAAVPDGRRERTERDALAVLGAEWSRAVYFVAANPAAEQGDDDTFSARAATVCAVVQTIQAKAAASPGLWVARRARRAVLDAICLYMVQAVRLDVEADARRLAAETGYGRESCRLALHWLVSTGWLDPARAAAGVRGAAYRPSEAFSTEEKTPEWAQAATRPHTPPDLRSWWIQELGWKLFTLAQDCFAAPRSLGRNAGVVYQLLPEESTAPTSHLAFTLGRDATSVRRELLRLHAAGLVEHVPDGWFRTGTSPHEVAVRLGVNGHLAKRAERYDLERQVWAWWQAEYQWMKKPWRERRRRPHATSLELHAVGRSPGVRYPRGPDGRADHRAARTLVSAQVRQAA